MDVDGLCAVPLRQGHGLFVVVVFIGHGGAVRESLEGGPVVFIELVFHGNDTPGVCDGRQLPVPVIGVGKGSAVRAHCFCEASVFDPVGKGPSCMVGHGF